MRPDKNAVLASALALYHATRFEFRGTLGMLITVENSDAQTGLGRDAEGWAFSRFDDRDTRYILVQEHGTGDLWWFPDHGPEEPTTLGIFEYEDWTDALILGMHLADGHIDPRIWPKA